MKKEAIPILLPTKEESGLQLNTIHNHLFKGGGANIPSQPFQHLHICTTEEIKEGDWVLNPHNNEVFQAFKKKNFIFVDCLKIIATTDINLKLTK